MGTLPLLSHLHTVTAEAMHFAPVSFWTSFSGRPKNNICNKKKIISHQNFVLIMIASSKPHVY
jgi:hypothetical protein